MFLFPDKFKAPCHRCDEPLEYRRIRMWYTNDYEYPVWVDEENSPRCVKNTHQSPLSQNADLTDLYDL